MAELITCFSSGKLVLGVGVSFVFITKTYFKTYLWGTIAIAIYINRNSKVSCLINQPVERH